MSSALHKVSQQVREVKFPLDSITLAGLSCGDKEHAPLLCLHGYLDNAASFLPLMREVIQETGQTSLPKNAILSNRHIIALDWPGHGHSQHRNEGAHYHFFDYVSDLVALFHHNNWPAIDIVAHSMGAMVACAFAAAFPEKVKSLTLIDSLGFICTPAEQTTEQLRTGLLSRIKKVKATRTFSEETALKARLSVSDLQEIHAKLLVQRALITAEGISKNNLADSERLFTWRSDPRLRTVSPYRLTLVQGQQLLRDIKCPVQLIYGDKGMEIVIKGLSQFSSCLANFTKAKLSGGHHVHMEQSEQVCNLLNNFYRANKIKTSV